MKFPFFVSLLFISVAATAQEDPGANPLQVQTQLKLKDLIDKKAEYNRLTNGEQDGYRIKIHSGVDRDAAEAIRIKFSTRFTEYATDKEYRQPDFVVLVGNYRTKLEAFESLKKIRPEFPNAFIVKGKIKVR